MMVTDNCLSENEKGGFSFINLIATIVNSARVSFGKHKTEIDNRDKKLINYLIKIINCFSHSFHYFKYKLN